MLDLSGIDVDEIATALADQADDDHQWLIDPRTGETAFWTHPELISAWHNLRDVRAQRRAVEWLCDHGLIDDDAEGRFSTDHPDPALP